MHSTMPNESNWWRHQNHRVIFFLSFSLFFSKLIFIHRLVGDKYIISCHVNCWSSDFFILGVNVWDLRSFLEERGETSKPTFTFSESTLSWHEPGIDGVRDTSVEKLKVFVDDYQVGCLITWDFDYERREVPVPMLYFMDFSNHLEFSRSWIFFVVPSKMDIPWCWGRIYWTKFYEKKK